MVQDNKTFFFFFWEKQDNKNLMSYNKSLVLEVDISRDF